MDAREIELVELRAERDKLIQDCEDLRISSAAWERETQRLRSERDALLSALDDIVTAAALPGDHCELDDAIKAAGKLLPGAQR